MPNFLKITSNLEKHNLKYQTVLNKYENAHLKTKDDPKLVPFKAGKQSTH